jgi:hypothetical protein
MKQINQWSNFRSKIGPRERPDNRSFSMAVELGGTHYTTLVQLPDKRLRLREDVAYLPAATAFTHKREENANTEQLGEQRTPWTNLKIED